MKLQILAMSFMQLQKIQTTKYQFVVKLFYSRVKMKNFSINRKKTEIEKENLREKLTIRWRAVGFGKTLISLKYLCASLLLRNSYSLQREENQLIEYLVELQV